MCIRKFVFSMFYIERQITEESSRSVIFQMRQEEPAASTCTITVCLNNIVYVYICIFEIENPR